MMRTVWIVLALMGVLAIWLIFFLALYSPSLSIDVIFSKKNIADFLRFFIPAILIVAAYHVALWVVRRHRRKSKKFKNSGEL